VAEAVRRRGLPVRHGHEAAGADRSCVEVVAHVDTTIGPGDVEITTHPRASS